MLTKSEMLSLYCSAGSGCVFVLLDNDCSVQACCAGNIVQYSLDNELLIHEDNLQWRKEKQLA